MAKSSVHIATKNTRGTHRKTAHKVGAVKAHSTNRKAASKAVAQKARKAVAEKARTTYRKTAAQFDPLAGTTQMPESVRALAEKSVAQTRELYVHSLEAVLESWEGFVVAAGQGAVALNLKAIDIARRNINDGLRLAESLAGATNVAEAMELQTAYWRKQLGKLAAQAGEMRTLSFKVTADVAAPIRAQVTRGLKGLHKAT
jgi:hypothetical protein